MRIYPISLEATLTDGRFCIRGLYMVLWLCGHMRALVLRGKVYVGEIAGADAKVDLFLAL